MNKLEIIFGSIFLLGNTLKISDIPGGNTLIVFSSMSLAILYAYFSYFLLNNKRIRDIFKKSTYLGTGVYKTLTSIFTGWSLGVFGVGVSYMLMYYSGRQMYIVSGITWIIVSIVVLLFGMIRHKEFVIRNLKRILVVALVSGLAIFANQLSLILNYFGN